MQSAHATDLKDGPVTPYLHEMSSGGYGSPGSQQEAYTLVAATTLLSPGASERRERVIQT